MTDKKPDNMIDLYEQNEVLALESALFTRQTLNANEKRHTKMSAALDKLINEGQAGSTNTERLIRNIKNLEEMMVQQRMMLPLVQTLIVSLVTSYRGILLDTLVDSLRDI